MAKIPCLYFPNDHRINSDALELHTRFCRQYNWNKDVWETCPFNGTHLIPRPEFAHHMEMCPDRLLVESFFIQLNVKQQTHAMDATLKISQGEVVEKSELLVKSNELLDGSPQNLGGGVQKKRQVSAFSSAKDLFETSTSD